MRHTKTLFLPRNAASKMRVMGKTEKQDYKGVHGTIAKNLGYYKEAQSEERWVSVLIVGIYVRTTMKAADALVCSEGILEYFSLSSLRARNCSYPSLEKFNDFPMPTQRSDPEGGLTSAIGPDRIDIVPCEQ